MDVTILTPSLLERRDRLIEAQTTVMRQTVPAGHFIALDLEYQGPAVIRNRLLERVTTPWVGFLDDDDLLDRNHVETLLAHSDGADVVIPYCRFTGRKLPRRYCNRPYDREALRQHGIFPITVIARTERVREVGGFWTEDRYEDWSMWNRMADAGCVFRTVPVVTWTYRIGKHGHRTDS